MLLYSGNFQAAAEVDQFENSRLVMGLNPYHFNWTLEPGAVFTAPESDRARNFVPRPVFIG